MSDKHGPSSTPTAERKTTTVLQNPIARTELQQKCDDLEAMGILRKPEDVDISVEYLNPSFLVKKPNGGHRLVTAFEDVGRYSKPQPSLMPDVDSTLRNIAHNCLGLNKRISSDSSIKTVIKVLWHSHTIPGNTCVHQMRNGHAWL